MMTLNERVAEAMKRASKMIELGLFEPHLITFDASGEPVMTLLITKSRESTAAMSKHIVKRSMTDTCLVVMECWMATPRIDENYAGAPSEHPSAFDALFVHGETREGETAVAVRGVKTTPAGASTYPVDVPDYTPAILAWNLFDRPAH